MKVKNVLPATLCSIFLSLLLHSCQHESVLEQEEVISEHVGKSSFHVPSFDPHVSTPIYEWTEMSGFIQGYIDGMSFFSDFYEGDAIPAEELLGSTAEEVSLEVYNYYLTSIEEQTLEILPISMNASISSMENISSVVKNGILDVVDQIDNESTLEDAFEEYNDILQDYSVMGASARQLDTIGTVLYVVDMYMKWIITEGEYGETQIHSNDIIIPRFPGWLGYRYVKWKHVKCALGIAAGAILGEAGGPVGVFAGAYLGGMGSGCNEI